MNQTIVVGGSGFIGQAIQTDIKMKGIADRYVFSYREHPERIQNGLQKMRLNMLDPNCSPREIEMSRNFDTAIYIMGNNNHALAWENPPLDLDMNVKALLKFLTLFDGKLVLLSSQAVYFGLEGEICESVDHHPEIPYAISKKAAESYCKFFYQDGRLESLWVYRLMYAFGIGERPNRLISACRRASLGGEKVNISGAGSSFINPLPSSFVADILVKSSEELQTRRRFSETTNINHGQRTTVLDVVQYLCSVDGFEYSVVPGGEKQPVHFWGNTDRLQKIMKRWQLEFPDLWDSLRKYYLSLPNGGSIS